jgi:hypothetical protein
MKLTFSFVYLSCRYLVKCVDPDRLEAYGYIEYFIGCDEFCSTYAYIQHIDTSTNNIKDQIERVIDVKQIFYKCIAVSFGADDSSKDFMFITEFDNEIEHD